MYHTSIYRPKYLKIQSLLFRDLCYPTKQSDYHSQNTRSGKIKKAVWEIPLSWHKCGNVLFLTCRAAGAVFISLPCRFSFSSMFSFSLSIKMLWFLPPSMLIVSPCFCSHVCAVIRLSNQTIQAEAITFHTAASRQLFPRARGRRGFFRFPYVQTQQQ